MGDIKKHIKKYLYIYIFSLFISMFILVIYRISSIYYKGNILLGFNSFFQTPQLIIMSSINSYSIKDLFIFFIPYILIATIMIQRNKNKKKYKKGKEHGSAKWGNEDDIKLFIDENFYNNVILSETEFITMNSRPKNWKTARNKNLLVIGGSGTGKTRSIIKPNLMQMNASYVVTDPKGTIVNELGNMFLKHKYKLKILNLIDLKISMKYNPLSYVKSTQDILKLVETLIENTSIENNTSDDFWTKAEKLLYQALIAGIIFDFEEEEQNLSTLSELLSLMEVREDDENFKNAVDVWFDSIEEKIEILNEKSEKTKSEKEQLNNLQYTLTQYKSYKLAAGKTAKSILISCASRLSSFNIPEVKNLISKDELELNKIGLEKTALFIIIPDTDRTYNFIASIMYTQLFNLLCTIADSSKYGGRLPVHVRCLLDEFANVGKIPNWEILIATIRSREISATMILQTKSQLKALYKDNASTIIGNCDAEVFLGGKERDTRKDIAEDLGKETIYDYNESQSKGSQESRSLNHSKLGSELISAAELNKMDRGKCIVQISGINPFMSNKYDITKHPRYKYHANYKDKNWLDIETYLKSIDRKNNNKITLKSMLKKTKQISKIKENVKVVNIVYEGDEVYYDTEI